jgi:hypothetical protein
MSCLYRSAFYRLSPSKIYEHFFTQWKFKDNHLMKLYVNLFFLFFFPFSFKLAPATDDTAARDEVDVTTLDDDEKADGFPLAPTSATETDDAASEEVNGATVDDETDSLLLL